MYNSTFILENFGSQTAKLKFCTFKRNLFSANWKVQNASSQDQIYWSIYWSILEYILEYTGVYIEAYI